VLTGQSPQALAWRLAGFGAEVLVLGPLETRQHLAEIGWELVGVYASSS